MLLIILVITISPINNSDDNGKNTSIASTATTVNMYSNIILIMATITISFLLYL